MVVDSLVYPALLNCGGPFCLPRFLTETVLLGGPLLDRQDVTHVRHLSLPGSRARARLRLRLRLAGWLAGGVAVRK